jgi:hypothetical protein
MLDLKKLKKEILDNFHQDLVLQVKEIIALPIDHQRKAKAINSAAGQIRNAWIPFVSSQKDADKTNSSLVLQYCYSVASLEYRNMVWPYEYMAFSRRVGELWEGFCSAAWDYPNRAHVKRFNHPKFDDVRKTLRSRINTNIGGHELKDELQKDIDILFDIIADINMREDEVFEVDGVPHVIDFKSGFGSNEKGNMLRLQTVGRAYKLWNIDTKLLLLVRQSVNNNYLKVLKDLGLWEVHTGVNAYNIIAELTGADIQRVRAEIIDWGTDLSPNFIDHLSKQTTDLRSYLEW